jgi:hypothetical protein
MNCLLPLNHWEHWFESHLRHKCLCMRLSCVCAALCVDSVLTTGSSPSKESYSLCTTFKKYLQCVLAARILNSGFCCVYSCSEKKIRAGFDMSDRTIPLWAHLVRRPLTGLLHLPRMTVEQSVEWELAGEATLSTRYPSWSELGSNPSTAVARRRLTLRRV